MCREAKLPILVFNYKRDGAIERAIAGHPIGTVGERVASVIGHRSLVDWPRSRHGLDRRMAFHYHRLNAEPMTNDLTSDKP